MKKLNVGINGLGRIGRNLVREYLRRKTAGEDLGFEITSINNPGSHDVFPHLLENDSVHHHFKLNISEAKHESFVANGQKFNFFDLRDPSEIPWESDNIDIVIDASGVFRDKASLGKHLRGTVKKAILCAPGKEIDGTFVMGINHENYNHNEHNIISNASCTTNCLAPIAKVLNDTFGIENGFMTTVHAYTSDQNLLDNSHGDLRRSRAAALSIIPTSTGAAKALGLVIPELQGKLDGYAVRVPTPNVSMVDLTVNLKKTVTKEEVNTAIRNASESNLKGILAYTEKELVGIDYTGRPESSIFDAPLTNVIGNNVKVVSWYDNEVGFSNRVLDLAGYLGSQWQ